jgi:hypothetical protein
MPSSFPLTPAADASVSGSPASSFPLSADSLHLLIVAASNAPSFSSPCFIQGIVGPAVDAYGGEGAAVLVIEFMVLVLLTASLVSVIAASLCRTGLLCFKFTGEQREKSNFL